MEVMVRCNEGNAEEFGCSFVWQPANVKAKMTMAIESIRFGIVVFDFGDKNRENWGNWCIFAPN
jgi:hypothetical protein